MLNPTPSPPIHLLAQRGAAPYHLRKENPLFKLLSRKLVAFIIILPILHVAGFYYALVHPRFTHIQNFRSGQLRETDYRAYLQSIFTQGDLGEVGGVAIGSLLSSALVNTLFLITLAILIAAMGGCFSAFSLFRADL